MMMEESCFCLLRAPAAVAAAVDRHRSFWGATLIPLLTILRAIGAGAVNSSIYRTYVPMCLVVVCPLSGFNLRLHMHIVVVAACRANSFWLAVVVSLPRNVFIQLMISCFCRRLSEQIQVLLSKMSRPRLTGKPEKWIYIPDFIEVGRCWATMIVSNSISRQSNNAVASCVGGKYLLLLSKKLRSTSCGEQQSKSTS